MKEINVNIERNRTCRGIGKTRDGRPGHVVLDRHGIVTCLSRHGELQQLSINHYVVYLGQHNWDNLVTLKHLAADTRYVRHGL